jgi:hypothetical protein
MTWFILGVFCGAVAAAMAIRDACKKVDQRSARQCREELAAMVREGRVLHEVDKAQGDH